MSVSSAFFLLWGWEWQPPNPIFGLGTGSLVPTLTCMANELLVGCDMDYFGVNVLRVSIKFASFKYNITHIYIIIIVRKLQKNLNLKLNKIKTTHPKICLLLKFYLIWVCCIFYSKKNLYDTILLKLLK